MSERIKALEKELELAKKEAKDIQRTTRFEEFKKHIGLVYYNAHVLPGTISFTLNHIKNIVLQDNNDRINIHLEYVTCGLSPYSNAMSYGKNIEYCDIFSSLNHMLGITTVSIDVFKVLKHRAKTSVKSFLEIMKTLTDLKIPILTIDNMYQDHQKFEVDFPHIKLDDLMCFLDHTPFTIGNKYLLTPKSAEFAMAKIRDYKERDSACADLYEACDGDYLRRMNQVLSSIDRQILNFLTGIAQI